MHINLISAGMEKSGDEVKGEQQGDRATKMPQLKTLPC